MMPTKPSPQRPAPRTQTSNHRSQYFEQHHNEQSSLQATATNWQPLNSSQAFSQPSSFSRPLTSDQIDGNQFGSNSLRYVNVRVVIPADTPTDHVAGYVHSRLLMQQQREVNYDFQTGITPSAGPPSHYHVRNSNHGFSNMRPSDNSHYEFVPINTNMTSANLRHQYNDQRPFRGSSSPFSPIASNSMYSFEKGSPSPSMLTLDTAEMTESSCYSSFSTPASSRICSPAGSGFMISPPLVKAQQQRSSSATSFQSSVGSSSCCSGPFKSLVSSSENNGNTKNGRRSPAYINGRKSPAKIGSANGSSEDDEVRKCRIKTEMCLHYINGTTCPFGTSKCHD